MTRPQYKATPDELDDGQFSNLLVDSLGNLLVNSAVIGSTDDAAWDGESDDATVISLLKAIALNTTPAEG